ncbi:MAG: sigma-70 family RNA polymerase sigma factor [Cytophagales bacterium]|nr:sigma-70 family RNA polymerase sigma factor [Cytophagales bacterium]
MASKIRKISTLSNLHEKDTPVDIEQVYRKYFDRLFSYARIICDSEELAKDVVSDFFYRLLKNRTDLSKVDNLEVYLAVGVKNLCIQRLKKSSKVKQNAVLLTTVDYIDPQQVLLGKELKALLDKIVNELPDQCQLVFRMSKEQGMTNREIADELQIGLGTVKTQLIRAQSKIRDGITSHYKERNIKRSHWRLIGQFLLNFGAI